MKIEHGGLYLADLRPGHGHEPAKARPVVVIQSDLLNETGHPTTWVVPCSTRLIGENVLRVYLTAGVAGNHAACEIMVDQSRAIDNGRLRKRLGTLPDALLRELKAKLKQLGDL